MGRLTAQRTSLGRTTVCFQPSMCLKGQAGRPLFSKQGKSAVSDPFPPGPEPCLPPSNEADGPSVAKVLPLCCFPRHTQRLAPFPLKILRLEEPTVW